MAERVKLLAFDTSTEACSVALTDTINVTSQSEMLAMQQGKLILPMIEAVLATAKIKLNELDAICYGQGPGSYTGARIAASVAQGLGYGLNCPLIGISSLLAAAQAAHHLHGWNRVIVATDARAQEIYWAAFQLNDAGLMSATTDEFVARPDEVISPFKDSNWYGVGNAWDAYGEILNKSFMLSADKVESTHLPLAEAILTLALEKFKDKQWVQPNKALPVYVR